MATTAEAQGCEGGWEGRRAREACSTSTLLCSTGRTWPRQLLLAERVPYSDESQLALQSLCKLLLAPLGRRPNCLPVTFLPPPASDSEGGATGLGGYVSVCSELPHLHEAAATTLVRQGFARAWDILLATLLAKRSVVSSWTSRLGSSGRSASDASQDARGASNDAPALLELEPPWNKTFRERRCGTSLFVLWCEPCAELSGRGAPRELGTDRSCISECSDVREPVERWRMRAVSKPMGATNAKGMGEELDACPRSDAVFASD